MRRGEVQQAAPTKFHVSYGNVSHNHLPEPLHEMATLHQAEAFFLTSRQYTRLVAKQTTRCGERRRGAATARGYAHRAWVHGIVLLF